MTRRAAMVSSSIDVLFIAVAKEISRFLRSERAYLVCQSSIDQHVEARNHVHVTRVAQIAGHQVIINKDMMCGSIRHIQSKSWASNNIQKEFDVNDCECDSRRTSVNSLNNLK